MCPKNEGAVRLSKHRLGFGWEDAFPQSILAIARTLNRILDVVRRPFHFVKAVVTFVTERR